MAVKQPEPEASVVLTESASRTLIRQVGPTAWAVLQDVSLDARREGDLWVAQTSVRRVAGHLGLTPGTVARSLARLCAAGLAASRGPPRSRVGPLRCLYLRRGADPGHLTVCRSAVHG